MTNKKSIDPQKIRFSDIVVLENSYHVNDEYRKSNSSINSFLYDIGTSDFKVNKEQNQVNFRLEIHIKGQNENDSTELGIARFNIEFFYNVKNLVDFTSESGENNESKIDLSLGTTIAALSFSTARGMIYQSLANTAFHRVILPVIKPAELLRNNKNVKF